MQTWNPACVTGRLYFIEPFQTVENLVVVQMESPAPQLLPEPPVLFAEVIDRVALLLTQPSGNGNHEQSKRGEDPAHGARIAGRTSATAAATCTI